jgi:anti-sigma B factor antagonist
MPRDTFTDFSVHSAPTGDGGTEITIFGELDLATIEPVKAAVEEALESTGQVVIDMRACPFVDSRGIAVLAHAAVGLQEQGRDLLIRGAQPRVKRILDVSGLTSSNLLKIEPEPSGQGERP